MWISYPNLGPELQTPSSNTPLDISSISCRALCSSPDSVSTGLLPVLPRGWSIQITATGFPCLLTFSRLSLWEAVAGQWRKKQSKTGVLTAPSFWWSHLCWLHLLTKVTHPLKVNISHDAPLQRSSNRDVNISAFTRPPNTVLPLFPLHPTHTFVSDCFVKTAL